MRYPAIIKDAEQEELYLNKAVVLLMLNEPMEEEIVNKTIGKLGLSVLKNQTKSSKKAKKGIKNAAIYHSPTHYWIKFKGGDFTQEVLEKMEALLGQSLEAIAPVYSLNQKFKIGTTFAIVPNVLVLSKEFKHEEGKKILDRFTQDEHKLRGSQTYSYYNLKQEKFTDVLQLIEAFKLDASTYLLDCIPMKNPYVLFTPNDPLFNQQWHLDRINVEEAWEYTLSNPSVRIAILDTGCSLAHEDLQNQYLNSGVHMLDPTKEGGIDVDSTDPSHGTLVAGVAAADINNEEGVAGVAGESTILPIALGKIKISTIVDGIYEAMSQEVDVINMSFGLGRGWGAIDDAVDDAINQGIVLVAATGNDGDNKMLYPAKHPKVIAVGGATPDDLIKEIGDGHIITDDWGSNYAKKNYKYKGTYSGVSVCSPGVNIVTTGTDSNQAYVRSNGTSLAAPQVSGVAALMKSLNPRLTNIEIRNIIEQTAARVGNYNYQQQTGYYNGLRHEKIGYGRLNARFAVERAKPMHITAITNNETINHTIRFKGGSNGWQSHLGTVPGQTSSVGNFIDVDCSLDNRGLYVTGVTNTGELKTTTRRHQGNWTAPFNTLQSNYTDYRRISCSAHNGRLAVVGITATGKIISKRSNQTTFVIEHRLDHTIHTISHLSFADIACSLVGFSMHICAVTDTGDLMHTEQYPNLTFQHYMGTVNIGNVGKVTKVDCAGAYGQLHVVFATDAGRVYYTRRNTSGSWEPVVNLGSLVGNISAVADISCTIAGATDLHVCAVTTQGELYHTMKRSANTNQGAWQTFWGNVGQHYGAPNDFTAIGIG